MKRLTQEEFIKRAQVKNPNVNFSNSIYVNTRTEVYAECPKHGSFSYLPKAFMHGTVCPECAREERQKTFIEKANKIHGDKYIYDFIHYTNNDTPVEFICPEHGSFWSAPCDHLKGYGCGWCSGKQKHTTETWISKVKNLYNGKYSFEHVNYIDNKTKVLVTCSEHGDFDVWPTNFMKEKSGCPMCKNTSQNLLYSKLQKEFPNIKIEEEARPQWLGLQRFDIYFPDYNIAVEYDGIQHFTPVEHFGGKLAFDKIKVLDSRKEQRCKENNCILIRVKYNYSEQEYSNLIEYIKQYTEKPEK